MGGGLFSSAEELGGADQRNQGFLHSRYNGLASPRVRLGVLCQDRKWDGRFCEDALGTVKLLEMVAGEDKAFRST